MLESLRAIARYRAGETSVLGQEKWLCYLALTKEQNVNLERVSSLEDLHRNYTLDYTEKTLLLLEEEPLCGGLKTIAEEVLMWSEVAKGGLPHQGKKWLAGGVSLYAHNIGSAQIYAQESPQQNPVQRRIVHGLIATHGLLGQSIRGEVPLSHHRPLLLLLQEGLISEPDLCALLICLNRCIVSAVSQPLWEKIAAEAEENISLVLAGRFPESPCLKDRLRRLRSASIQNGENFEEAYQSIFTGELPARISRLLANTELWYVEAALFDFSFEEFIKILLIIEGAAGGKKVRHISFEKFMRGLYYQHGGKKRVNIYKKRIIEKYLSGLSFPIILQGEYPENVHVSHEAAIDGHLADVVFFNFRFSPAAGKLIEFCMEAEKSGVLYEKAVLLLFDLFNLRKDAYDRFYEEEGYLKTMNGSIDYKSVLLADIKGDRVLDIGPGGGALMDLIESTFPGKTVTGVDIAQNVLESLKRKKQTEQKKWEVLYGDALNLPGYVEKGSADTIVFCSILHELYSYIETGGKKFNKETLAKALKGAFKVLAPGGRILIRDGIMTEPSEQERVIRFLSEEGMAFLKRYAADFKGREIAFSVTGHNEVRMPINDAMEFLYTYTWGEKSYVHEVQEQFGYFTPSAYKAFISSVLGENAKILKFRHFLQDGYTVALAGKIEFLNPARKAVPLPDSTCIIVIEKIN